MEKYCIKDWLNDSKGESYIYDGLVDMLKLFLSGYIKKYPNGSTSIDIFIPKNSTVSSGLVEYIIFHKFLDAVSSNFPYISIFYDEDNDIPYSDFSIKVYGDCEDVRKILKYVYSNSEYIYDFEISKLANEKTLV